jgi:anti-anti-sigma regulatory factor
MNHTIQKSEKYAIVQLQEAALSGDMTNSFEESVRGLLREGFHNIIVGLNGVKEVESAAVVSLRKINSLCAQNLGVLVLATKDEDLWEQLDALNIPDMIVLPSVDEAIDAVFMHELENEFGLDDDDYDDEDYVSGDE